MYGWLVVISPVKFVVWFEALSSDLDVHSGLYTLGEVSWKINAGWLRSTIPTNDSRVANVRYFVHSRNTTSVTNPVMTMVKPDFMHVVVPRARYVTEVK